MKKIFSVLVLTLAVNFLAVAGGVGWLFQSGHMDKEKMQAIKTLVFPPPDNSPGATATTQPTDAATTQPLLKLEELLAAHAGRAPGEQVEFIKDAFDTQMAQLDRRKRELDDLARQVEIAKQQATRDRLVLTKDQTDLQSREELASKLATDKGFQDALKLYTAMPPKQVKAIFLTMDDDTVRRFIRAMQPRQATKIIKEFKTPDETARLESVMKDMGGIPKDSDPAADANGPVAANPQ